MDVFSFLKYYKDNQGNNNLKKVARDYLVTDMLVSPKYKKDKLKELDDCDMETVLKDPYIPGLILTFLYVSESDVVNGISFKDYMPILLCCEKKGNKISGINLNMIPREHRAVLLELMDQAYAHYYSDKGIELALKGQRAINEDFGKILLDPKTREDFMDLFEHKSGCSMKRAYRTYNLSHIKTPRLIEYSSYKYIPILDFEGSIKDAEILKVQEATVAKDDK